MRVGCVLLLIVWSVWAADDCYRTLYDLPIGQENECKLQRRDELPCSVHQILFVGDSIVRNSFVELLQLYRVEEITFRWDAYKGHRNFHYQLHHDIGHTAPSAVQILQTPPDEGSFAAHYRCADSVTLSAVWAPFVADQLAFWNDNLFSHSQAVPPVIVMNMGPWDLLHHHDETQFSEELSHFFARLRFWASRLEAKKITTRVYLFNLGVLETSKMASEEKRTYMTEQKGQKMSEIVEELLWRQEIDHFVSYVDIHQVMQSRPPEQVATEDGVHPTPVIARAINQLLLNSIHHDMKDLVPEGSPVTKFVGRYPILGLFVGIYLFAALASRDTFLITHFLLSLLSRSTPNKQERVV